MAGRRRHGCASGPSSEPLRRCRPDSAAEFTIGRRRDLVPMRRRSTWLSVDRRPCPCRRARGRSAIRRGRRAGRSGHVLLPRRTPLAQLFSIDPGPQHHRGGRPRPVDLGWPLPLDASGSKPVGRLGERRRKGRSSRGPPSTTATESLDPPLPTADRCDWPAHFGNSRSSTASRRREDTPSGWRSTWAPTSMPAWSGRASSSPGRDGISTRNATLLLPDGLSWSLHRGETDPVLGWYSPRFGAKQPAWARHRTGNVHRVRLGHLYDGAPVRQ